MTDSVITKNLDMLPMRMLGENMLLHRYQWEELVDELHPKSLLRVRIMMLLEAAPNRRCVYGRKLSDCAVCDSETNCYR